MWHTWRNLTTFPGWKSCACLTQPSLPTSSFFGLSQLTYLVVAVFFFVFFFNGLSKSCSNADSQIETLSKGSNLLLWLVRSWGPEAFNSVKCYVSKISPHKHSRCRSSQHIFIATWFPRLCFYQVCQQIKVEVTEARPLAPDDNTTFNSQSVWLWVSGFK